MFQPVGCIFSVRLGKSIPLHPPAPTTPTPSLICHTHVVALASCALARHKRGSRDTTWPCRQGDTLPSSVQGLLQFLCTVGGRPAHEFRRIKPKPVPGPNWPYCRAQDCRAGLHEAGRNGKQVHSGGCRSEGLKATAFRGFLFCLG